MAISAAELTKRIQELQEQLDEVLIDARERTGRSISRELGVSATAVQLATGACRTHELLANNIGSTGADVEARVADLQAWLDAERELTVLLASVRAANRVRRHRVGKMTWQVYHILKQLLRQPAFAHLQQTYEQMQHELGRRRKRTKSEPA